MMKVLAITACLLAGTAADAQLLGQRGAAGATAGALGQTATGSVQTDVTPPSTRPVVTGTGRTLDRTIDSTARSAGDATAKAPDADVNAGASAHVAQGTRCTYQGSTYDPAYRDGYYYCDRTGLSVSTQVKAGVK